MCVGGGREGAQLCSPIFWERQGGVVDPPAPFSLQLDLVEFQQLHPLTKHLFVIFPRRTNTTATRRRERKEEGRWTVETERVKGGNCSAACASLPPADNMVSLSKVTYRSPMLGPFPLNTY